MTVAQRLGSHRLGSRPLAGAPTFGVITLVIESPRGVVDGTLTEVRWLFSESQGRPQHRYRITLKTPSGTELSDTGWIVSDATSHRLDYAFAGNSGYVVELRVQTSQGQEAIASSPFTVVGTPERTIVNFDVGTLYDVAINGIGYMLVKDDVDVDWGRRTVSLEAPRFSTGETPFNEAIERYSFIGQNDWSGGRGQSEGDRPGAVETAFLDSDGVDPFTEPGELRLLPATVRLSQLSHANPKMTVLGSSLYVLTGDKTIGRFTGLQAGSSFVINAASTITDLISDGRYWYACDGTGIWRGTTAADPGSTAWSDEDVVRMTWAGHRICAAVIDTGSSTANVFKTIKDDGSEEDSLLTLPPGYDIRSITSGGGYVYFSVVAGNVGSIYAWRIGDSQQAPFVVWELPAGEVPQAVYWYQNNLFIRAARQLTTVLYRAAVSNDGRIAPFLLAEIDDTLGSDGDFVGRGRFVFFSWSSMSDGRGGIGCVDLASGGYAKWLKATDTSSGSVNSIVLWRGTLAFSINGTGVYVEDPSTTVAEGYLDTSIRDGGSALEKVWDEVMLQARPLANDAQISLAYTLDRGSSYIDFPEGTLVGNGQFRRATKLGVTSPSIGWRITLKGSGARLRVLQTRAHPLGLADFVLVLPIDCSDDITLRNGQIQNNDAGDGAKRLRQLEALAQSQVRVQDIDWRSTGLIEDYEVLGVEARRTRSTRDPAGGTVYSRIVAIVTLRRTSGTGQQVGRPSMDVRVVAPPISVFTGIDTPTVPPTDSGHALVPVQAIAAWAQVPTPQHRRGATASPNPIAVIAHPRPVNVTTTSSPPVPQKRAVIGLHGGGGGFGPGNFGSAGNYPVGPFDTVEMPSHTNQYRVNGQQKTGLYSEYGSGDYLANLQQNINRMLDIIEREGYTHVIVHGFSWGGGLAAAIYASGTNLNGTLVGCVIDDAAFYGGWAANPHPDVKAVMYSVWNDGWVIGNGNVVANEQALGLTSKVNPHFTHHHPMTRNVLTGQGPDATDEELTDIWWGAAGDPGGGDPEPPTGDSVTIQAETFTLVNPAPDGMRVSQPGAPGGSSGGYNGSGYIGYWWQSGERVRFQYNAGTAGTYQLTFRYRSAMDGSQRQIVVNGNTVATLAFPRTAQDWSDTTWGTVSINVNFNVGTNTVELVVPSNAPSGVDLDEVTITAPGGTTPPPPPPPPTEHPMVIEGVEVFPADHFAYADISGLPVRSDSNARINGSLNLPTFRPEWGSPPYNNNEVYPDFGPGRVNGRPFGYPLIVVEANAPTFPITQWRYSYSQAESDDVPLPIPLDAPREHNSDYHILCLQKGTNRLFELWDAHPFNGGWSVGQCTMWDLTSLDQRPAGITAANAAGTPMLPLSINYDEVARGEVTHAASICMTYVSAEYEWPANHVADWSQGVRNDLMKMGTWLRLKASVDLDARGLGPQARVIAEGLKKHGAIVIDVGPKWKLNALADDRWDRNDLMTLMNLRGQDFEVVDVSSLMISDRSMRIRVQEPEPQEPQDPEPGTGVWRINEDGRFVDPDGNIVRLIGGNGTIQTYIFNMTLANGSGRSYLRVPDMKQWGWNVCRLTYRNSHPYGFGLNEISEAQRIQELKQFLVECANNNIVVILADGGDVDSFAVKVLDQLGDLSPRVRSYLWFNGFSEPTFGGSHPNAGWRNGANSHYNAVRNHPNGKDNIVLVGTMGGAQRPDQLVNSGDWDAFAAGKTNVAIDWHPYAAPGGVSVHREMRDLLKSRKIPYFIGEFGFQPNRPGNACCAATYVNQRAVALDIINNWFAEGDSGCVWIATGDANNTSVPDWHSYTTPDGTYQDWLNGTYQLSEMGAALWAYRNQSHILVPGGGSEPDPGGGNGGGPPPIGGGGTGKFEIQGRTIISPEGRKVRLIGANGAMQEYDPTGPFIFNMPVVNPPRPGNARSFFSGAVEDVKTWGWNVVRVPLVPTASPGGPTACADRIIAMIDEFSAHKIVVMPVPIEYQAQNRGPGDSNWPGYVEFWNRVLTARGSNPYLWVNFAGESWSGGADSGWVAQQNYFYNFVRQRAPDTVVVFTGPNHGQMGTTNPATNGTWDQLASGKTRIMLDWHPYAAWGGASVARQIYNGFKSRNIPLIIGEFAWPQTPASGPPSGFNPGACCGATYANQRAVGIAVMDEFVPDGTSAIWWIATGDSNSSCSHSLRYNPPTGGTYQDWNMPFSEAGQKWWNRSRENHDLGPA